MMLIILYWCLRLALKGLHLAIQQHLYFLYFHLNESSPQVLVRVKSIVCHFILMTNWFIIKFISKCLKLWIKLTRLSFWKLLLLVQLTLWNLSFLIRDDKYSQQTHWSSVSQWTDKLIDGSTEGYSRSLFHRSDKFINKPHLLFCCMTNILIYLSRSIALWDI